MGSGASGIKIHDQSFINKQQSNINLDESDRKIKDQGAKQTDQLYPKEANVQEAGKQQQQQKQVIVDIEGILKQGFQQKKVDLIKKRVSLGRRSVSLAQNAGTIQNSTLSLQPRSFDEKVITSKGQDTRKKIDDTLKYPFCSIGFITMDFFDSSGKKIQGFGTGCLIHKRVVLTCAHNVYDRERNVQAFEVYFIPAMNGDKGKRYRGSKFYYPQQYRKVPSGTQHEWDFALIQLQAHDLSQSYGYLGINTMMNGQQNAMIYGYPNDLNSQFGKKWLFGTQGLVRESKKSVQQLNYDIPTAPGQSGSPIIRKVIGVHIRYIQGARIGDRDSAEQNCNSGVKFTEFLKNMINGWIKISSRQLSIHKKVFSSLIFKEIMNKKWDNWNVITVLNLSKNNITGEMLFHLISQERRFPNLITLNLSDNNIECEGAKHLASNLNAFPNLEQLVLNKNKLKTAAIQYLVKGHQCFPVLSGLYLANNKLDGNSITALTRDPSAFSLLDNLDLAENQIERSDCDDLVKLSHNFPNLTQFGIARNGLSDQGVQKLFSQKNAFYNASQLSLANNMISGDGIMYMMKKGKNHFPNLTRLWLENNILGSDGCKWLARNNVFPNLVQLLLFSNQIGEQGVLELTSIQNAFPKVEDLHLQNNGIGDNGVKYFSMNQFGIPRLTRLFLDKNNITSQGVHNLILNRQAYPRLKVLSLQNNQIDADGIKYLMYQCEGFFNLEELQLQKNKIGDQGLSYFCQSLNRVFGRLKVLALRQNGLTTQSVRLILNNQQSFVTLKVIGLNMNALDSDAIDLLVSTQLKLPNLQNLWLVGNKIKNVDLDRFTKKYPQILIK